VDRLSVVLTPFLEVRCISRGPHPGQLTIGRQLQQGWTDPYRWIVSRLHFAPGGELVFLSNRTLIMPCSPDEDGAAANRCLGRPQLGMQPFEWPIVPAPEFHLSPGDQVRLLRADGSPIVDLIELRSPAGITTG
jgi:hypothetical protein